MYVFTDQRGAEVHLSFEEASLLGEASDVLVVCSYEGKWLLTEHKIRGREFPGGKREKNETLEEAAKREVFEETGGVVTRLRKIGAYKVIGEQITFVKAIFRAEIGEMKEQESYFETAGPILVSGTELTENRLHSTYSYLMQDDLVKEILKRVSL